MSGLKPSPSCSPLTLLLCPGIPTAPARRDILRVLLKRVPHSLTEGELDELASSTHGFVGADLSALVREAGMRALQRTLTPLTSLTNGLFTLSLSSSRDESSSLVSSSDFVFARTRVRASAMRELFVELPKVGWADIAPGTASVHDRVRECVEWPLRHADALKRLGVKAPAGVLLYGPPGCSKTLIARALASESGLNFVAVKGPEVSCAGTEGLPEPFADFPPSHSCSTSTSANRNEHSGKSLRAQEQLHLPSSSL